MIILPKLGDKNKNGDLISIILSLKTILQIFPFIHRSTRLTYRLRDLPQLINRTINGTKSLRPTHSRFFLLNITENSPFTFTSTDFQF